MDPNYYLTLGVLKQILRNVTLPWLYMVYGLEGDRLANAMYHPSYFLLVDMHPPRRPKGNNSSIEPYIRQCKE